MKKYPDDEIGIVLSRLDEQGFDFSVHHPVEFFVVLTTEEDAERIGEMYVDDHNSGDEMDNIETRPHESGGMELELVKVMQITHENISGFQETLRQRVSQVDGFLDGWGLVHS